MSGRTGLPMLLWLGCGIVLGVMSDHYYEGSHRDYWREQEMPAHFQEAAAQLTQALALSNAQQAQVEPIVVQAYLQLLELRFAHQPEVERIITQTISRISEHLSPDQQDELGEVYARLQDRWQRSRNYLLEAAVQSPRNPPVKVTAAGTP
ncbi:MAG: hypothetical protein KF814_03000 [Nitrospiraceae bacterium]|nr:hypothetical protein [Nitrospiraceae bacterium]